MAEKHGGCQINTIALNLNVIALEVMNYEKPQRPL